MSVKIGFVESDNEVQEAYQKYFGFSYVRLDRLPPYNVEEVDIVVAEPHPIETEDYIKLFRSHHPETPLIVTSFREDILRGSLGVKLNVGAITKPFHLEELREMVEVILDEDYPENVSVCGNGH